MFKEYLDNLKITELNKMQQDAIAQTKNINDLLLLSPTGSGKTLAFLLPVISKLKKEIHAVQCMIIVPSRELALQVEQVFKAMQTSYKINCCYGGHSTQTERNNLTDPPAVLVGTPGRLAYHVRANNFDTHLVNTLVLDEFDKSLELGFQKEMSEIIAELPELKRRLLTSATAMNEIPDFVGITKLVRLNYLDNEVQTNQALELKLIKATGTDKLDTLFKLICFTGNKSSLVFCNHRDAVDRIGDLLGQRGIAHGVFHGGMEQEDRERALIKFRNGSHHLLITTDLASRGLDIPGIAVVIHYQLPLTEEAFTHRNGRTARMFADGTSYLVLAEDETLPDFITQKIEEKKIPEKVSLPNEVEWITLYFGAGKKEKINKMDLVGFIIQKGEVEKEQVGKIEVLDHASYVAVHKSKASMLIDKLKSQKIKNQKIKIAISY